MKKRFLSIMMALCVALSLLPATALAAEGGTQLPTAVDGVITLDENVTLPEAWQPTESVILDLSGYKLSLARVDVQDGVTVTITDSKDSGKIEATSTRSVVVSNGGTLILENGTITSTQLDSSDNIAIFNMGTFTIKDGKIEGGKKAGTGVYNTVRNSGKLVEHDVICNIEGGVIEASYGVCALGPGVLNGDLTQVDNEKLTINITDGTIKTNGQGIATNASSGRYAGFTVNMSGGAIEDIDNASTGMYLPAIGVTNITRGTITASQAIRIGAGELNISGGTITCTATANGQDLIPGGSGGTTGAIVVGKASGGYVGDIEVNVSGSAVIQNTAEKSDDSGTVYPTIVVSDKNMADTADQQFLDPETGAKIEETFNYSETKASVIVNARVDGDVVKTSTLSQETDNAKDGGNTTLEISGGTVTGNVINQTRSSDLEITGGTITGNVTNSSKGETVISNAEVVGTVSNTGEDGNKGSVAIIDSKVGAVTEGQDIILVDTSVGDNEPTTDVGANVAIVGAKGYPTLEDAIDAANKGDTVRLLDAVIITDTITIAKDITITAVEGATVTAKTDGHSFVLSNGATLDGLTVELADGHSVNIVQMGNDSTVKNCKFTGGYSLETDSTSGETSRAIEGSSGELTITGNTFENLRQPAYINACTGKISNNHVSGTRGWVICGNSNMEITGNTFGTNAVDIAIIDDNTGDPTNTNNYAEKITELSKSNDGAYTQNQLSMAEAEDGALVVGKSDGYTLDKALAAAQEGDTVRLLDNVDVTAPISLPEGVTLDGGNNKITYTGGKTDGTNPNSGAFITATEDDVTIKNITIEAGENIKHGVQFYQNEGGKLSGVTVNGAAWTSVMVNGATNVTIEDCVLNPGSGAYANIEYGMGSGVTTVPTMTVDDVTVQNDKSLIYVDQTTLDQIGDNAANKVQENITNKGDTNITIDMPDAVGDIVIETPNKPTEPDDDRPSSSGGSSSEPSYSPVMDVSKGGSVKVNPRTPGEGDEVTITVDPDSGYEVGDVTVTDRSGRDVRVTAGRDGTYTFEQPKGRVTIAVTFVREGTSTFFTDVAETYWAYDEIAWAYENGYVNGVTATTFAPGASISRQQIWMILARIAGDDPADMAAARQWSIDNGISDGTNPGSAVTRQQLAALLFRFAELMGLDTTAGGMAIREFPDYEAVASYAAEAMDWAVSAGIINGTTDGTLNPTGTATRAQFAVMLYRFWTGV